MVSPRPKTKDLFVCLQRDEEIRVRAVWRGWLVVNRGALVIARASLGKALVALAFVLFFCFFYSAANNR